MENVAKNYAHVLCELSFMWNIFHNVVPKSSYYYAIWTSQQVYNLLWA